MLRTPVCIVYLLQCTYIEFYFIVIITTTTRKNNNNNNIAAAVVLLLHQCTLTKGIRTMLAWQAYIMNKKYNI